MGRPRLKLDRLRTSTLACRVTPVFTARWQSVAMALGKTSASLLRDCATQMLPVLSQMGAIRRRTLGDYADPDLVGLNEKNEEDDHARISGDA